MHKACMILIVIARELIGEEDQFDDDENDQDREREEGADGCCGAGAIGMGGRNTLKGRGTG